jgi:hypothetical protein
VLGRCAGPFGGAKLGFPVQVFHQAFTPLEWTVPHLPENVCFAKAIIERSTVRWRDSARAGGVAAAVLSFLPCGCGPVAFRIGSWGCITWAPTPAR